MKMLTVSALVCAMMALILAAEVSIPCSTGWFPINGRWFHFVPQPMTWAQAERNCQSLGGNLASIHNIKEYQQIQELTEVPTWIGGSDAEEQNQWLWSDGAPFSYSNWCPGEPNNSKGIQRCLQINYKAEKCWDNLQCSIRRPSLCVMKN